MPSLSLPAFLVLAAQCTPLAANGQPIVPPETLASVVQTESGFGSLAVGVNEAGVKAPAFGSLVQAAAWVTVNAHRSIDVGVTQINTRAGHMQRRGLPVSAALDPCVAIRVGAEVLRDCYRTAPAAEPQQRLRQAASCYNAGNHWRGFENGYVRRFLASAEVVVPAIRLRRDLLSAPDAPVVPEPPRPRRPALIETLDLLHPAEPATPPEEERG